MYLSTYTDMVLFFFALRLCCVCGLWRQILVYTLLISVASLPETVHMVFKQRLLARKVFARSMKVFGWKLGT